MDGSRFDALVRSLRGSRRSLLGGAALAVASGLGLSRVEAKKARRHKDKNRPKVGKPNAFGCLNVGEVCRNARQCCSGICQGRKGRKRCRAHDSGGCAAGGEPEGCGGTVDACTTSAGAPGTCATTTGNAGYCLAFGDCVSCATDADCQTVLGGLLGPRAACIQCATCEDTGGTACAAPFALT